MAIRTILFDADGVLFNNEEGITKGVQFALRYFNVYVTDLPSLRQYIGPPLLQSFQEFQGFTEENAKKAVEYYRRYFREKGVYQVELYEGVPEMLKALRAAGYQIAVASSKPKLFVRTILRDHGILPLFDKIIAADMKGTLVEKADVIAEALRQTETPPAEALMIGDRKYDAAGAAANGVPFAAALYGFGSPEEFDPYPCVCRMNHPADITAYLTKQ